MPLSSIFNPDRPSVSSDWSRGSRDLLLFFISSLFLLTCAGVIYKVVFVIYNSSSVNEMLWSELVYALLWGLRFDLASAAMFSLLVSIVLWPVYRASTNTVSSSNFLPLTLLMLSLVAQMSFQVGDSIYYTDAGRHVSYEMRDVIADASGLFLTAITYHAGFILLSAVLGVLVLFASLRIANGFMSRGRSIKSVSWKFNLQYEASMLLIFLLAVICIRGGVTGLPQSVISAFKIGNSQQAVVAMNGSYSVIYGMLNSSKEVQRLDINLPENLKADEVMKTLYSSKPVAITNEQVKKYNLVFVFMEGWPAELMASYGYDQQTTPFYDSILKKSYAPLGIIAGGRRTTEGMFATLCSQQNPLGETVAQSSLQNFSYRCLPEMLREKGWSTAFFQGSHKETSGTGAFAQSMGFVDSYAIEDMSKGRYQRNFWGAHDPDIYDFAIDKMDSMRQPFMVGINTNSTHDTALPQGVAAFFDKDESRDDKRDIMYFADQAMKEFFDTLKTRPYYNNTLFVFMSDHTSGVRSSTFSKYLIPGAIYAEDIVESRRLGKFVSQRDIAPTVLDLLDMPAETSFSGKSFYVSDKDEFKGEFYSDYYDSGSLGWVNGSEVVETNISQPDAIRCYTIDIKNMKINDKECDERGKLLSEQSLVFTSYSQDRLFKGETEQFYKFLDN